MNQLYNHNGLIFWNEEEIYHRNFMADWFPRAIVAHLKRQNKGFDSYQIEASILTPKELINNQYSSVDYYSTNDCDLVLRPETTMGSYVFAKYLLTSHLAKFPLIVWQYGKSFRREQDQVTKNMRLKEFYQLEFQIIFSTSTMNDYSVQLIPYINYLISTSINKSCTIIDSDRLPSYSLWTKDIMYNDLELCSISQRNDFEDALVLEVAIGMDRCVYARMQ